MFRSDKARMIMYEVVITNNKRTKQRKLGKQRLFFIILNVYELPPLEYE